MSAKIGSQGKRDWLRIVYGTAYFCTATINLYLAVTQPEVIGGLADFCLIPLYRTLIISVPPFFYRLGLLGFFAYQVILGYLLLRGGKTARLGFLGGIAFHLAIVPFGVFNLMNIPIAIPLVIRLVRELREESGQGLFQKLGLD